jgi:hypothetical protein
MVHASPHSSLYDAGQRDWWLFAGWDFLREIRPHRRGEFVLAMLEIDPPVGAGREVPSGWMKCALSTSEMEPVQV